MSTHQSVREVVHGGDPAERRYRFTLRMRVCAPIAPADFEHDWDFVQLQRNTVTMQQDSGVTKEPVFSCEYAATESIVAAIVHAVFDIRTGFTKATLVSVGPDLVTLSEAARLANVADSSLQSWRRQFPEAFPKTAQGSNRYRLADMLRWLHERRYVDLSDLLEVAETVSAMNTAIVLSTAPAT